jgi:LmbE family N-acetylglucosaminyl deacetylase
MDKKPLSENLLTRILAKILFMKAKARIPGHPDVTRALNKFQDARNDAKAAIKTWEKRTGHELPDELKKLGY